MAAIRPIVFGVFAVVGAVVFLHARQAQSVRVTSATANIRSEMSETSAVLTQVKKDTLLDLVSIEPDWFRVRVPIGALRVEAYISKKVAKLDAPAPGAPAAAPAAPPPPPKPASPPVRDGMSVAELVGTAANMSQSWLAPTQTRVIQIGDKVDSIARSAAAIPAGDAVPAGTSGSSAVTYVWIADGPSSSTIVDERRPSFLVEFKEVPGFSPDDLMPVLVRVGPASSGVRVIGAVRGRADAAGRTDADWDVTKDFKQDVVKADVEPIERGIARVTPSADLASGQYAIVMRLVTKKKLSGAGVLRTSGEARLFNVIWDFTIK